MTMTLVSFFMLFLPLMTHRLSGARSPNNAGQAHRREDMPDSRLGKNEFAQCSVFPKIPLLLLYSNSYVNERIEPGRCSRTC